ncbi:MAG: multidrug resistance efflux transporter family protein [Clostridiales bacterium]|nr:multidrug resistance efflux transporter family protein [Clostridiales bacterium]
MKKAFILGLLASFFFAFTFLFNRSMHLTGGSWVWSASLRYLFTFPILAVIVWKKQGLKSIHTEIWKNLPKWLLWSSVGFGLFYAPLSFAGDYGESWLIAASWQITIVMGILLAPLFKSPVSLKNLCASGIIIMGVFLLQAHNIKELELHKMLLTLVPILIAAVAYPLGNRKMMVISNNQISTMERTYGMTLCSLPFWFILSLYGVASKGAPSSGQMIQAFCVALISGVIATLLFFKATDLVKSNQQQLAVIESTQAGEVLFTLLGGVLFLKDATPDLTGWIGILLIVFGMILNSLITSGKKEE